jgi:glycine cleavage system transcriptional repressor
MKQNIVISLLGEHRADVISDITQIILECGGNIIESRMSVVADEFTLMAMVSGGWHTSTRMENRLQQYADNSDLMIRLSTTPSAATESDRVPYAIDAVCLDQQGIVHQLSEFFIERDIEIAELNTRNYAAAHTGAPMFAVQMAVKIPAQAHISSLRDEFLEFCDRINLDAIMEPIKS